MARYVCSRCKAVENMLNEPHLCKDLRERYERQAKATDLIAEVLDRHITYREGFLDHDKRAIARDILKAISGRDLGL